MGLKLLCVVAHPDDECFAFGGALLLAAKAGVETTVLCLTDGQAAANRGDATSGAELGRIRRAEFAASCNVLGVTHHQLLDYQDAQLEHADFSHAAARLVEIIRTLQPHVVLTFGLDGGLNTHPDHTMVSAFTTAAFHWAASAKRFPHLGPIHRCDRLYHASTSFFLEGRPQPLPAPWTLTLDITSVFDRKREAFRQHLSQAPLMHQTSDIFDRFGHTEYYTLVASPHVIAAHQTSDLFAGLIP